MKEEEKWNKWDTVIFGIAALIMVFLFVTVFSMMLDGTFGTF